VGPGLQRCVREKLRAVTLDLARRTRRLAQDSPRAESQPLRTPTPVERTCAPEQQDHECDKHEWAQPSREVPRLAESTADHTARVRQGRVYGFWDHAREAYEKIATGDDETRNQTAEACTQCGECENLCPQDPPIRERMQEIAAAMHAGGEYVKK